jgi:AraC-like DNA-binding protein
MDEQQPYLHPDFSLDDLARLMDVPKHHLYYCFNHILHRKFTQVRAAYRVRHACRLIEAGQTQEKTLEAIGLEAGFSSRSSFIIAFREVTGLLPRAYQQALSAGQTVRVCLDRLS